MGAMESGVALMHATRIFTIALIAELQEKVYAIFRPAYQACLSHYLSAEHVS